LSHRFDQIFWIWHEEEFSTTSGVLGLLGHRNLNTNNRTCADAGFNCELSSHLARALFHSDQTEVDRLSKILADAREIEAGSVVLHLHVNVIARVVQRYGYVSRVGVTDDTR